MTQPIPLAAKTAMPNNKVSALRKDNRDHIRELKALLEQWVNDAISRPEFTGHVSISVHILRNEINGVASSIEQKVRNLNGR